MQRLTSRTLRKTGSPSVNKVQELQYLEDDSAVSDGSVHVIINMATSIYNNSYIFGVIRVCHASSGVEIVREQTVIATENWGSQLSKEYLKYYSLINDSIETNFGAAKFILPLVIMAKTMEIPNTKTPKKHLLVII